MKKLVSIMLMIALVVPCAASAEVLADGWQNAGLDALIDAQEQIAKHIEDIRAENAVSADPLVLTGSGTTIVQEPLLIFDIPARIVVSGNVELTLFGEQFDHEFNSDKRNYSCERFTYPGEYTALVEGEGEWEITIEPIKEGGTLEISGTGPYVSDFFDFDAPTIMHVVIDNASYSRMGIRMGHYLENIKDWGSDAVIKYDLYGNDGVDEDVIIKPTKGESMYYWIVDVPEGVEWSITAK